jgi:2-hydroxy-6-oxo-6-(2'-aminophenyl)hexa-2,4-dienoate hydrolase
MKKFIALSILSASWMWAQAPASKQVEVFGQKIHYLEAGSGPNVILLHGLGADANNWVMNTAFLAKSFHVFVPDQIGFGDSDKPPCGFPVWFIQDVWDNKSDAGRQFVGWMDSDGVHAGAPRQSGANGVGG